MIDVPRLKNAFWVAVLGHADHGSAQKFGRGDVLWEQPSQKRQERPCHSVEDAVAARSGLNTVQRLDDARTKHIGSFEGQAE